MMIFLKIHVFRCCFCAIECGVKMSSRLSVLYLVYKAKEKVAMFLVSDPKLFLNITNSHMTG